MHLPIKLETCAIWTCPVTTSRLFLKEPGNWRPWHAGVGSSSGPLMPSINQYPALKTFRDECIFYVSSRQQQAYTMEGFILVHTFISSQEQMSTLSLTIVSHASTNITRRHKHSQGVIRLLSVVLKIKKQRPKSQNYSLKTHAITGQKNKACSMVVLGHQQVINSLFALCVPPQPAASAV